MRFFLAVLGIGLVVVVGLDGCSGGTPEEQEIEQLLSETTPGELVEEFTMMAKDRTTDTPDFRRFIIANRLASMGPKTLTPLLELMAAPESSGETRLFVLQTLADRLTPLYLDDLTPMLVSENAVIRACAVTLLGHIDHPDVLPLLAVARNDADTRVSFSALSSQAVRGDEEARKELCGMYFAEDAKLTHKREVIRVILRAPVEDDLEILKNAVIEDFVLMKTRALVARTLGKLGDSSAIEPLKKSLDRFSDPVFIELASAALEEIQQRSEPASASD